MKLVVNRFEYEPPGISVIPETDFEVAVWSKYWESAMLYVGRASSDVQSKNGLSYAVKFGFDIGAPSEKPLDVRR